MKEIVVAVATKKVRALCKGIIYRVLDLFEGVHARVTRRAWYTPGASAAEGWVRALAVSDPCRGTLNGEGIVSLTVQNGAVLSGPADPAQWNSIPVRVARMRRIARAAGLEVNGFASAHFALLDNIVNRYVAEFSAYPHQPLRTLNLLPGDVFIDIGAFRGYVAVKAAQKVGREGHVYAIEPIDENFAFVVHHREVNGLRNLTALKAAVTEESGVDSVDFFRTENQGNAAIKDHLQGDAHAVEVANLGARALVRQVRTEAPAARRIVCSVTTNGTEVEVAEALMHAMDDEGVDCELEITIPVIFTESQAQKFADRVASQGWRSDLRRPWLRLWRRAKVG